MTIKKQIISFGNKNIKLANHRKLLFLLFISMLTSCGNDNLFYNCDNDFKNEKILVYKESIFFNISDTIYSDFNSGNTKSIYINNLWYLVRITNNEMTIINIKTKKIQDFKFDIEASFGINEISDFIYLNADSIYLLSLNYQKVILTDTSFTKVKEQYDLISDKN